jgi:imidazolonepropionase-like amidohydrolase
MTSVIYAGGAIADGRSAQLRLGVSILVEDGKISWIRPAEDEGDRPADCEYVDAGGTTIVPGLVD